MPRSFMFYAILIFALCSDQGIKIFVRGNMYIGESHGIIGDLLRFTYVENRGIAFSFMEGNPIFLYVIPAATVILGWAFWRREKDKKTKLFTVAMAMTIGGALGNLIDRFIYGSVTDYVDVKNFAIFNLADVFIQVGLVAVAITILFEDRFKLRK